MKVDKSKITEMLLHNTETLDSLTAHIISISVLTETSVDDVLNEANILIRAKILKAENDGMIERLKKFSAGLDSLFKTVGGKDNE